MFDREDRRGELVSCGRCQGRQQVDRLTIILPAYNEASSLPSTLARVAAVLPSLRHQSIAVDVVVVSDGSSDMSFEAAVSSLEERSLAGTVIELARNTGSHAALRCGLQHTSGGAVALMAADGQDPPELLPAMLDTMRESGVDILWGHREDRSHDALGARTLARAYYGLFRRMTGLDYPPDGLDFVVVSPRVVQTVLGHRERNAALFLLLFNLGYPQSFFPYQRGERAAGASKWSLSKRIKLAFDMIVSLSAAPIRIISALGVIVGIMGLTFGLITLIRGLLGQVSATGWPSLMVVLSVMGGLTLVGIGVLGEYVWRALDEVRGRPVFIESRRWNRRVDKPCSYHENHGGSGRGPEGA